MKKERKTILITFKKVHGATALELEQGTTGRELQAARDLYPAQFKQARKDAKRGAVPCFFSIPARDAREAVYKTPNPVFFPLHTTTK